MSGRLNLNFKADNFSSIALLGGLIFLFLGTVSVNMLMFILGIGLIVLGTTSQSSYLSRIPNRKRLYNKSKRTKGFTFYKPNSKRNFSKLRFARNYEN